MPARLQLTLACDDFDIVRPLIDGTVEAEGIDLVFVTELSNPERHRLMLREQAFDVCELNVTNYLVARDQDVPLTAMPVFLFRKFRHGNVFINTSRGIREPADLKGRRIGAANLQVAANVWIAGILQEFYGVAPRDLIWVLERDEDFPFDPPRGLTIERPRTGGSLVSWLLDGTIDALLAPLTPAPVTQGDARVARLFPDYRALEQRYFETTGIFPIMHVTALKSDLVARHPWVPLVLTKAFEEAKRLAYARTANTRLVPLAWFEAHLEHEHRLFGPDAWPFGLTPGNRRNLETIIRYAHEQGLTRRVQPLDGLFCPL